MTTNLLNNLSNVLKKGPSETQKNPLAFEAQSAAEKSNRVLITCLSRVNHLIQYRCMRYAALLFAVLVMSVANVGTAWAWATNVYLNGNFTGDNWSGSSAYSSTYQFKLQYNSTDGKFYIPVYATGSAQYFRLWTNNHCGPATNNTEIDAGDDGCAASSYDEHNWKYVGDAGIISICIDQTGGKDWNPWVWVERPDIYIRHKWNNSSLSNEKMTDNGDGTYQYIGKFSSSSKTTYIGPCSSCSSDNVYFKKWTSPTMVGSPTNGDRCIFEYNASGYKGVGSSTSNTGTITITKLYSITYDGNGKNSGSVPSAVTDKKWNESTTIADNTGTLAKTGYVFAGWNTAADGTGTYYAPGSTFTPSTASTTLYAQWLNVHTPGLYETAAGSGGYGQSLVESDDLQYEVYQYAISSSKVYVYAGTSTTSTSAANYMLHYATSSGSALRNWMLHSGGIYGSSDNSTHTKEFKQNTKQLNINDAYKHVIAVSGYDQFSIYAKDKTVSSQQVEVYINGSKVTAGSSTSLTVRRYNLTPETTYIIRIEAIGSGSNASNDLGFSLRVPSVVCGATQPGTITKGTLSGCSLRLTAGGSAASNNTWYWQSSSTGTDKTESGATKDVTSAGTYYIRSYYSTGTCWSDAQSVTVSASDLTPAAPTALAKSSVTAKGVTLTVTDAANTNDYEFYVSTSSSTPSSGATATHSVTSAKSLTITNLYAGTTFYAWARAKCGSYKSAWTALTGNTFTTSTVSADYHLTNVTKSSGATTGIGGSTFTAVFAAVSGYSLPSPVVTIGGNSATSGTDYTWTAGTGTLTINANKINGDIDITMSSPAAAPSSVAISGDWLYFAGETIELTATPTGGNGPVTYQWYKGGKTDGDEIDGATSATYSKASCAYEDAGSYYCKVTCGGSASTWGQSGDAYDVKIPRLYVKTGHNYDLVKPDYGNVDFTRATASTATASIVLGSNWDYCFNIADGCGHYYGNAGTMQYNNYGPWTTNVNNQDCGLRTTNGATYIFTIDYSNWTQLKTTVTFPSSNQAADKIIYFDNQTVAWSTLHYRIGRADHTQATPMTKVPGTNNLYTVTTAAYSNAAGWHIANNAGWTGSNSIYRTYTNGDEYSITYATAHEGGAVTDAAVTVTPTTTRGTGADAGINDNCTFYNYEITTGMKTQNVAISDYSNGTITVNYVNTSNEAATLTSGNADLAHSVILTSITAVPNTGYDAGAITINGGAYSANYVVTGATTIAASFTPHVYNITLNKGDHGAANQSATVTYLDDELASITHVTSTGYTLTGYYDGSTKVLNANGTFAGTDITGYITDGAWTKTADATLTAKWEAKTTTITINANTANHGSTTPGTVTATYGSALPSFTAASGASGYSLTGYYTDATSGTKIINEDGTLVASTSYADGSGNWNSEAATLTLYAQYEEDETPCFQMVADASAGSDATLANNESISQGSKNCTTLSGGTAVYSNADGDSKSMKVAKPSGGAQYGWYFNVAKDVITITLPSSIIQVGSVITFSGYVGSANYGISVNTSTTLTKSGSSGEFTKSYTVTAGDTHLIGKNVLVLKREGGSAKMYSFSVSNCQAGTSCVTPVLPSLTTPNQACTTGEFAAWNATVSNAAAISAAAGSQTVSYSWKNSSNVEVATTASYTPTAAGTYTVTATVHSDASGYIDATATSSTLTASLYTATSISTQPTTAVAAEENENFTLGTGMVAAGQGDLSYQWYSYTTSGGAGEASIGSATSATYTTSKAEAGTYYYKVKVTADCGTVASNMITVTVSEAPCFKFKCESQGDAISSVSAGGSITAAMWAEATLTGGTMKNSGSASLGINKTYGIVLDGSTKEVTVTLGGDHVLAVGSVITLKAGVSDASGSQTSGLVVSGNTCSPASYTSSTAGAAFTQTYTVTALDGLAGTKSFTVAKKSDLTKTYLNGITVTGCEEVSYYSVTYAAGGASEGSVPVDANSPYEAGETVTVLGNTGWLFKSGYNFAGWDSGNDGVKDYDEDDTFTMPSSDVTLTAVWGSCTKPGTPTRPVIDEGTLTHTGAKFSWDPDGITSDASGYMVSIVRVSDGYVVRNWTSDGISIEDGGYVYAATGLSELTSYYFIVRAKGDPETAYICDYGDTARYTFSTLGTPYTITYHLNGASWINEGATSYRHGTGYTLPVAGDMSNTGYTFGGWYDNSGLTGSAVTEISAEATGDKEFWAKWTENEYDVTYNANGGSGDAMSATHGHYVTISDNSYTAPSGKAFVEWNTANDGSGASYNPGDEIELTANLPLYAIWAKAVTTINWSVTKVDGKLYRGGGGYSVTAEIDDANWDASASDASKLELTATEGVVLKNVTTSINGSGKAQITANFDITTDVNANATKITFTLNVPENNDYAPAEDSHDESLTNCTGGKVEVRFLSSNKNDKGDNFADMSNGDTQLVGDGFAKLIAIGSAGLNDATNKIGYRSDRVNIVFKLASATTLDIYFNANATNKTMQLSSFSSAKTLAEITSSDYSSRSTVTSGLTVANVAFSSSSHSTSAGTNSVSSGVVKITAIGGVKASYSLSAGYYVLEASGEGYFFGFDADGGGGGGSTVTPTLTWSGSLADAATVNKYDTDVDFTYSASQDKNSLGTLTYSSSDETVATVNASGKVHILKAGTTTITANLEESGCYEEAEITYTLNVISTCTDVAGTLTAVDNGCDGVDLTVSGHTGEGVNTTVVKWYKDGVYQDDDAYNNKESITVTAAGEWSAQTTAGGEGHCVRNSNSVTVTARSTASATRIVNQWYVKNGRRTPDIALVQTTNAVGFYVKVGDDKIWDEANSITTGFGGCDFYLGADGIIYLKGQTSTGAAPSDLTAGDVTLKITATGCGSNSSELSIVIHKQAATTAKSVAFVVDGTKGGAITAFTASHATTSPLYVYLDSIGTAAGARKFTLTGRNAYWSTVDSTLKAHYSQFDIILITDDPNTQTVPTGVTGKDAYKTKGYINALGTLIDIRPILSMEAFVSRLTNWGSKGIKGNPTSPNPRQYEMRLQCKDHEIYSGLPAPAPGTHVWSETIGGEEYRHVIMIDSTKSPYTGWAYNSKTDSLPALQGFTAEAMGDLLGLGVISNGTLQAGIERQEEPAARLLLLGVNAKALPNALTEEGKRVISNALTYLLKTNMEEVDDCSNYFTGKTSTDWNTVANWSKGSLPNYETKVRILAPCEVSGVTAHVAQVDIVSSGESSIRYAQVSDATCNGKLTINANGALIVEGKVRAAEAPHFATNDLKPTTVNDLVLNTSSANQAALIFNNDEGKTQATVNLYSLGRTVSETNQFQYFAIPMSYLSVNPTFANETHGITIYTYVWLEATGWERRGYYTDLYAFEGIGITTDKTTAHEYTMKGTLASTKDQEIPITADGKKLNLIGNSWTAPIQISELEASDFGDASSAVEQTVYIYCTGHGKATSGDETETAGQWLAIPFNAAGFGAWDGLKVIPSMQAFQIKTTGAGTLTLDYKKHVRGGTTTLTEKLRAPKRKVETDGVELMRIRVADSQTHTDLYLFEGDQFTDEFDNGWEANYRVGTSESAKLYARVATGVMSVAAMPSLESTPVYFIPGQETEYMFTFGGEGMGYYLNDIKMQRSTLISTEATYSFTYEKGDAAARFYISKTPIDAGDTPTGVSNTDATPKAQKIIYDNKLYIIVNGALYDATGKKVNSK